MLSRLPLDLPTATPEVRPSGDRIAVLEDEVKRLKREHRRLMEALASWYEAINKGNVLEIADAVIIASQGIKFPATQVSSSNANTLDDYEEGSTAPTVTAGSGTITTVTAALNYTKIGNRVAFDALITLTTNGTGAGYLILPLPFTPAASRAGYGRDSNAALALNVGINVNGTALIFLYDGTYPGADGKTFHIGGTYRV